jgi:hypothetical protein
VWEKGGKHHAFIPIINDIDDSNLLSEFLLHINGSHDNNLESRRVYTETELYKTIILSAVCMGV